MSSVDNRIVEMQFNNKRFEENARETMSTLDKLKDKLKFKDTTKELQEFQNAADSFNLSRIANTLDEIGNKFTLMGQLGVKALEKIASTAINAGTALVKSLSIDQIMGGMSKYEEETNIIQTIYGALKPKGYKLEEIYDVMETLTAYSDETSYSYTQMADAISKFVNAGVDLHKAETIIEGVSNVSALAGINIHETEIIYRNFADAIAKGKFTLQDWNSLKTAHIDTQWLKEAFIAEAIAQGKLDKSGRVQVKAEKKNKKGVVTQAAEYKDVHKAFEETLSRGWLDNEVITAVMLKYANRELEGFGKEAFAAAQNAKTFTDVLDAVKDSVSTGWSTSFRIIFGDLEEAIALFTPMANKVIEFTSAIDEARNAILTNWRNFGGRDSMIGALKTLWENFVFITDDINFALRTVFLESFYPSANETSESLATMGGFFEYVGEQVYLLTKRVQDAAEDFQKWYGAGRTFISIFTGIFSVVNIARQAIVGVFTFFGEIFKQLYPTFDAILGFLGEIGFDISNLNQDLARNHVFEGLAKNLAAIFIPLTSRLPKIINWVRDLYKRIKVFWNTNKRFVQIRKSIERLFNSFIKFIPTAIESVINFGKSFIEMVKNSDEWKFLLSNYNKYIRPWLDRLVNLGKLFTDTMSDFFEIDTSGESTMWGKLKKRFSVFGNLGPYLQSMWNDLKEKLPWLKDIEEWWNTDPVINEIKQWVGAIVHAIDVFLSEDTSGNTSIIGKIKQRFDAMWGELGPWIEGKWKEYKEKFPFLQQVEDFLSPIFGWGKKADEATGEGEKGTSKVVEFLENLWGKIQEFVSHIDFGQLALLSLAVLALVKVYKAVKTLLGWASVGEAVAEAIENFGGFFEELQKTLKTNRMLSKVTAVLEIAAAMWLLGDTLMKVSQLSWEEIARGLVAMAGLFVEEGAFMIVMTKFNEGPGKISAIGMIGTALSMLILAKALNDVASLSWEEIGKGLTTMAGLFVEEGAFTILVNRFGSVGLFKKKVTGFLSMIGIALSMWLLGKTLLDVASLSWEQIEKGLSAMGGLFVEEGAFSILVNRFGSPGLLHKKGTSFLSMIGMALSMKILADTLKMLAEMSWEEIGKGLTAMAGLFVEEGAFTILVNRFGSRGPLSGGGTSVLGILSTTASIVILANTLKTLADMTWEEIGRGLAAMAGLFTEEGAFMVIIGFLSKKDLIKPDAVNATTGVLAYGIGEMGKAMAQLGAMNWDEILRGSVALAAIETILGLFVGVMSKFSKIKFTNGMGMGAIAGAIWVLVQAFIPLTQIESWDQLLIGIAALGSVALVLGVFCGIMGAMKSSIKGTLGVIVSAIALAAMMVAFAFALTLIKDVDTTQILAFGAAMLLVSGAMVLLAATLQVFSKMNIGTAVKGAAVMVIAAAGLAAAVALILEIVGQAVQDFSENIAMVGANLVAYSEQAEQVNYDAIDSSVAALLVLSSTFVAISIRKYDNLDTFRTNLSRIGSSIKIFAMNTADVNLEKMKSTTKALKEMATDLSGLKSVSDVSTTIGNIAGAIKLYSDSLNGVTLGEVPDATDIERVYNSLKGAIPSGDDVTEVAGFAAEGKGDEMTNFAIGLTNIATAVSKFSENAKDLDFDNIQKAINALTAISLLDTSLTTTEVKHFGPFATEVHQQKEPLSNFAEDIIALGAALNDFGNSISTVNTDKLTTGTTVLGKIVELNNALPPQGGISSWILGSQSLTNFAAGLRLLGRGAVAFSQSIGDESFNPTSISAAGDALIKIAEVNAKLPKTGGISSWFAGDEDLGNFSTGLKELGTGVKTFIEGLGGTTVTKEVTDGVEVIRRIASIQVALGNTASWYTMDTLGSELNKAADQFIELNNKLIAVTTWADTSKLEDILKFAVAQQKEIGNTTYSKSLKDMGTSLKDFFNEIWTFTASWNGGDSGKLDKVASSIQSIFGTMNETFANAETNNGFAGIGENLLTFLMNGFSGDNSKVKVQNAVNDICGAIISKVKSYTGTNQAFYNVGTWIPAGLGDGIWANRYAAINAAIDVMNAAIDAAETTAGISSPSKEFARLGMYSDMGLAIGLRDSMHLVDSAAGEVSQSALDTVLDNIWSIQSMPLDQLEVNPTIRPVLDMSNISSRADMINSLLGGSRTIGFNTRQLEAQAQFLSDASGSDINSINQQITGLRDQIAHLEETMSNIKMVVNTGALVGAMTVDVDKAMGAMSRRAERGN